MSPPGLKQGMAHFLATVQTTAAWSQTQITGNISLYHMTDAKNEQTNKI